MYHHKNPHDMSGSTMAQTIAPKRYNY